MTAKDFTGRISAYYGHHYTPLEQEVLGPWLVLFAKGAGDFAALFDAVTSLVSKAYGKLPDKAQLAEAARELKKRRDPNALPPPPVWEPPNLSPAEVAEMERLCDLSTLFPGYTPSGRDFTPNRSAAGAV